MKGWMGCFIAALLLSGCGLTALPPEKEGVRIENIQVENYFRLGPHVEYFPTPPKRALVIGAAQTELFLDMGLEESILGAVKYEDDIDFPIKACNENAFEALPFVDRRILSMERVREMQPDLIVSEESWFSKNRLGSTAYWNERGVATMVSLNTTSPGKTNAPETVDNEIQFIRDMGKIYRKEDQAERMASAIEERFAFVREKTKDKTPPKVMIFDLLSTTISYGRNKIAGDIAARLGGRVPETTASVGDETIISENPDVVFVVTYDGDMSPLEWMKEKQAFQHLSFMERGQMYPIPLKYAYGPMSRVIDAAGYMAERMYPGEFDFPEEFDFHPHG